MARFKLSRPTTIQKDDLIKIRKYYPWNGKLGNKKILIVTGTRYKDGDLIHLYGAEWDIKNDSYRLSDAGILIDREFYKDNEVYQIDILQTEADLLLDELILSNMQSSMHNR